MAVQEKTNIKLYIHDLDDDFFVLSPWDPLETPYYDTGGYRYFLPKAKAFFKFRYQFQEVVSFVEKVDEVKKEVYLSQAHWLYMKNLIKSELGLDVKVVKRYPGKLTVAELINAYQRIDKALIKQLAEAVSEKIYIKLPKRLK
jgi:hypothetical protein